VRAAETPPKRKSHPFLRVQVKTTTAALAVTKKKRKSLVLKRNYLELPLVCWVLLLANIERTSHSAKKRRRPPKRIVTYHRDKKSLFLGLRRIWDELRIQPSAHAPPPSVVALR
jgi:hypothetical protein